MPNSVTNKDLYEAIERLEGKLVKRIERLEACVDDNTAWRNQLTGKMTVLMIFIGAGINWLWDSVFKK